MMPLTTTYGELDEGLDILERAIAEEFGERSEAAPGGRRIRLRARAAGDAASGITPRVATAAAR